MRTESAEEWQASIDARVARISAAQRDQRRRAIDTGCCEVCGAPDAITVADFSNGADGIRRLCETHRKEAGLDLPPLRQPYAE